MLTVSVHITNLEGTQSRLTRIAAALEDMSEALESLATLLVRFFEDSVFESEGQALLDERWPELSEPYGNHKRDTWPGKGILQQRGDLRHGFTKDVTPFSLFITNTDPKFLIHQFGTASGPGRGHNIPARQMLGVNVAVEEIVKHEIDLGVRAKVEAIR